MRAAVTAFQEVSRAAGLEGAALVGLARDVLTHRVDTDAAELWAMAGAARTIFRDTRPELRLLDLSFPAARVAVVPAGDAILLLRALRDGPMEDILSVVWPRVSALSTFSPPPAAPPGAPPEVLADPSPKDAPDSLTARDHHQTTVEALNRVVAELRKHLGGPVIRNYLRKSQAALLPLHPELSGFSVDLSGTVSTGPDFDADAGAELSAAAAVWLEHALRGAAVVAPDVARLEVTALLGPLAARLGKVVPRLARSHHVN